MKKPLLVTYVLLLGCAECFTVSLMRGVDYRRSFALFHGGAKNHADMPDSMQLSLLPPTAVLDAFHNVMTVPEANNLLTPVFIASAPPCAALAYFLHKIQSFPRGATVGFACFCIFGSLAGPAEIFSQQVHGVSFFDCNWIHGTISSLFAISSCVSNMSILETLRGEPDSGYGPALRFCAISVSLVLAMAASEYWSGFQVHSPHWYGILDGAAGALPTNEPENVLSVATWLIHALEISQFQILLRLTSRWAQFVSSTGEETSMVRRLVWGLVPLQWSNMAIFVFHLFYNALAPVYIAFAMLLLFGNISAALVAREVVVSAPQRNSRIDPSPLTALVVDDPFTYSMKLLGFACVSAYLVKYGTVFVHLPTHVDLSAAFAVTLATFVLVVKDVQGIDSLAVAPKTTNSN